MKTNRAFTLIEVMVVLSILAIIAILAYNFFGSTMKDAVRKQRAISIRSQLQTLSDAYELKEIQTGVEIFDGDLGAASLLSAGYIRASPVAPVPGTTHFTSWRSVDEGGANAATDGVVKYRIHQATSDIDPELCNRYNEMYSTLGYFAPFGPQYNQATYCTDSGTYIEYKMIVIPDR